MNIYIAKNNQREGPYNIDAINTKLLQGELSKSDIAWMEGWTDWQPLSAVPGITRGEFPPSIPLQPSGPTPPPLPRIAFGSAGAGKANIASLDVDLNWKERFEIMERMGWNEGMWKNRARARVLSYSERMKIGFNIWGFLFGPFYYFVKGMWIKGAIIVGAALVLALLGGVPAILVPAYCCAFASYDFYLLKVYGKRTF